MPQTKATTTTDMVAHYSAQLASDLERNAAAQDAVRAELEHLEARLLALRGNHAVLLRMRQALESDAPVRRSVGLPGGNTRGRARDPRRTGWRGRLTPTLVSLVRSELAGQSAPSSAREITATLCEAHPDRAIKTTVVRTALEGLVAKGAARRVQQGRSVRYAAA
ncbi:hypothetical protein [Streptomyces mexicanus]|jgi:hypothetical protein|uniref:hypothetical protein n=1 Tax=Streptomyces mexicanus TaxID=178566 RepID=UPI00369FB1DC